jgi:hypothetical protein
MGVAAIINGRSERECVEMGTGPQNVVKCYQKSTSQPDVTREIRFVFNGWFS